MGERKILQIMPAAGWAAIFDDEEDELITPLVGWALVQDNEGPSNVVGLVAWERVELCDSQPNFSRYVFMADMLLDEVEVEDDDEAYNADGGHGGGDELPYDPKTGLLN